tara:strand:- start:152 stop:547 length:396 start_codon:yes stop_codon:yes gene_type:complete
MSNFTEDDIKLILLILGYDIESDEKGNAEYKDLIEILTRYINELSKVDEKSQLNEEQMEKIKQIESFKNIKPKNITEINNLISKFNKKPDCIGGNKSSNSNKTHGGKKINKSTKKRKTKKQKKLKKKSKKR